MSTVFNRYNNFTFPFIRSEQIKLVNKINRKKMHESCVINTLQKNIEQLHTKLTQYHTSIQLAMDHCNDSLLTLHLQQLGADIKQQLICALCHNEICDELPIICDCAHKLHYTCMIYCLTKKNSTTCPECQLINAF